MSSKFDLLFDIPETDEQAEAALLYGKDETTGQALVTVFQAERALGAATLAAYDTALSTFLKAAGHKLPPSYCN